jgi:hypothetical protein
VALPLAIAPAVLLESTSPPPLLLTTRLALPLAVRAPLALGSSNDGPVFSMTTAVLKVQTVLGVSADAIA